MIGILPITVAALERYHVFKILSLGHPSIGALDGSGEHTAINTQRSVVGQAVGFSAATVDWSACCAGAYAGGARVAEASTNRARSVDSGNSRDSRMALASHLAVYTCLVDRGANR